MDAADELRGHLDDVVFIVRDETFKAELDAEDRGHLIFVVCSHDHGTDDVVEARAKSAAGDDGAFGLAGVIVNFISGTGWLEIDVLLAFALASSVYVTAGYIDEDGVVLFYKSAEFDRIFDLGWAYYWYVSAFRY